MFHRSAVPKSTAETPDEQCKHNEQGQRTQVGIALWRGILRVIRRPLLLQLRPVFVAKAVLDGAVAFARRAGGKAIDYKMTCEGNLGDRSRVPKIVILGSRNQKREKQNADGRE